MRTVCTDIMMICKECGLEPWWHYYERKEQNY